MTRNQRRKSGEYQEKKVLSRKIQRNKLKQRLGTNKISESWRTAQIQTYGEQKYVDMRLLKTPQPQRSALILELIG